MMFSWLPQRSKSVFWTHTDLSAFVRSHISKGSSVIRRHESLRSCGAQKNGLRRVRTNALGLVRSQPTASARSVLRGVSDLPRVRGSAGVLAGLCRGVAREGFLFGRQCTYYPPSFILR